MRPEYKPLADMIFEFGAIKLGDYRLRSGIVSPIYIDLRGIVRHPRGCSLVATALNSILVELTCDLIADIPLSISPVMTDLMYTSGLSMITPRLKKKDHGIETNILGDFKPGQTVVLVDDLTTKAVSTIEVVEFFRTNGLQIKDVLVLIDREQGGAQQLAKEGCALHSVFKLRDLLQYYLENGNINDIKYHLITEYLKNN